jgi:aryl carrier-like protein
MEHRLARIFSTVLGVEQVGVTDNFFDLGGDSLKMIRLHATIGREVDATVSLLALYQHPSVRSLARSLSHDDSVAALPRQARRPAAGDERSRRLHARQQVAGGSALATSDGDGPGR